MIQHNQKDINRHKTEKMRNKILRYSADSLACICCFTGINNLYGILRHRTTRKPRRIILVYHRVTNDAKDKRLSITTKSFKEQMKYLKTHAQVFPLKYLVNRLDQESESHKLHIAITFDDGYMDNYENAYPILKEYNFPATIFLISDLIGSKNMLTLKEIGEMRKFGISFGSHTVSHPILSDLDGISVQRELVKSKSHLEAILREEIDFFAYPKGRFNENTVNATMEAGYKAAFTVIPRDLRNTEYFTMGRIPMRTCPMPVFKAKLTGLYHNKISNIISRNIL